MEWIKNHKKALIFFTLIIIAIPFLLQFLIFENNYPSKVSNDGWSGFFGGYIGAIIGALATIIAISIEIEHNKYEKQKDEIVSVRPYLYINDVFSSRIGKTCSLTLKIQNLGLQAACSIKIFEHNQDHSSPEDIYNSPFAIATNAYAEVELEIDLYNTEYYFFEYYDIKENLYRQEFRAVVMEGIGYKKLDHFIMLEPKLIQTKKERDEKMNRTIT